MITIFHVCALLIITMAAAIFGRTFRPRAVCIAAGNARRYAVAGTVAGLLFAGAAFSAEPVFTSPKGFTITPPDGWTLMSKDAAKEVSDVVKKEFPKFDAANLERMAVMLLNPADSGITNINVVVMPSRIPIGATDAEQKLEGMLREQYTKMGVSLGKLSVTRKTFGTHKSLAANFESVMGGASMRQWQVMMPAGSQTLIVTCTSARPTFEKTIPVFTKAIEGMTFSDTEFPSWLRYGIIGGVVGGLIGLFRKFFGSRQKA